MLWPLIAILLFWTAFAIALSHRRRHCSECCHRLRFPMGTKRPTSLLSGYLHPKCPKKTWLQRQARREPLQWRKSLRFLVHLFFNVLGKGTSTRRLPSDSAEVCFNGVMYDLPTVSRSPTQNSRQRILGPTLDTLSRTFLIKERPQLSSKKAHIQYPAPGPKLCKCNIAVHRPRPPWHPAICIESSPPLSASAGRWNVHRPS